MQKLEERVTSLEKEVLTRGIELEAHEKRIINLETNYKDVAALLNRILNNLNQMKYFVLGVFFLWVLQEFGFGEMLKLIKLM